MFEEFGPVTGARSANIRWFHELAVERSTRDDAAHGWFPAGGGFPARELLIPGPRRPTAEH